ncbi:hypothetical protein E4T38_05290 [Aureobasidium subglaciale]|nr:hypothetical protein E4T38_05290 [Aureobasidium subglaciale]KAI5221804.1 hypothetical protein E4T40_05223 [Aureobasidium subglaciale]KAI5225828.1 hypothetical protein E4T41_05042 [Aureobasidium subglaciale]KAI5261557.1 hypothetical protein E4T46_04935 [Aureobasidium subglaciale]
MTILLTGGTGKTTLRLAALLQHANIPFLSTSRRGPSASSFPTVKFDWDDSITWSATFIHSIISAVYLTSGELSDPSSEINKFIDFAKEKGVKSTAEMGDRIMAICGRNCMRRDWSIVC